jgi:hypothetical protein
MYDSCKARRGMLCGMISLVEARLYQPDVVPRLLKEPAPTTLLNRTALLHRIRASMLGHGDTQSKLDAEPLAKLLQKQRHICYLT